MKALSRNMCKNFTYKKLLVKTRSLEDVVYKIAYKSLQTILPVDTSFFDWGSIYQAVYNSLGFKN